MALFSHEVALALNEVIGGSPGRVCVSLCCLGPILSLSDSPGLPPAQIEHTKLIVVCKMLGILRRRPPGLAGLASQTFLNRHFESIFKWKMSALYVQDYVVMPNGCDWDFLCPRFESVRYCLIVAHVLSLCREDPVWNQWLKCCCALNVSSKDG